MTKVKVGEMFESMSGKYGKKHVLSNRAGVTVLSKRPVRSGTLTEAQVAHHEKFREAIKYATFAKDNPVLWDKYKRMSVPGVSPFNQAVADFITVPKIGDLDVSQYTGQSGEKIIVTASDKFEVISVMVMITMADGTLVEEGPAQKRDATSFYVYTTMQENSSPGGTVITATVTDNPGHSTVESATV